MKREGREKERSRRKEREKSAETDGKIFRQPSNNIPKIILMIDEPVIDTPSCL